LRLLLQWLLVLLMLLGFGSLTLDLILSRMCVKIHSRRFLRKWMAATMKITISSTGRFSTTYRGGRAGVGGRGGREEEWRGRM
jgi:hypothetical protein